jgi:polar amino acid transport system substrate-binding protein
MRTAKGFVVFLAAVALAAGFCAVAVAGDATRVAPVLDRILAKKELVVGTAADMPPLNMTLKDGRIVGMEMDIATLMADSIGVKLTLKPMHFNDLLPALEAGQVDLVLSGMTMTPLGNTKVAFAGPYFGSGKSVLLGNCGIGCTRSTRGILRRQGCATGMKGGG